MDRTPIPTFFHIPKCGGTYVSFCIVANFTESLHTAEIFFHNFHNKHISNFKRCSSIEHKLINDNKMMFWLVDEQNKQLMHLYMRAKNRDIFYKNVTKWTKKKELTWLFPGINIKSFFETFNPEDFEILFMNIKPSGISYFFNKIDELKSLNLCFNYFTFLRDPFETEQSLYFYLTNNQSKHELTFQTFKSNTFDEYLVSYEVSDSWLMRQILSKSDSMPLTEEDYLKVCNKLDNFVIADISNINDTLKSVMKRTRKLILPANDFFVNKTKNNPRYCLENYNKKIRNAFLERKKYDYKIYKKFCVDNQMSSALNIY